MVRNNKKTWFCFHAPPEKEGISEKMTNQFKILMTFLLSKMEKETSIVNNVDNRMKAAEASKVTADPWGVVGARSMATSTASSQSTQVSAAAPTTVTPSTALQQAKQQPTTPPMTGAYPLPRPVALKKTTTPLVSYQSATKTISLPQPVSRTSESAQYISAPPVVVAPSPVVSIVRPPDKDQQQAPGSSATSGQEMYDPFEDQAMQEFYDSIADDLLEKGDKEVKMESEPKTDQLADVTPLVIEPQGVIVIEPDETSDNYEEGNDQSQSQSGRTLTENERNTCDDSDNTTTNTADASVMTNTSDSVDSAQENNLGRDGSLQNIQPAGVVDIPQGSAAWGKHAENVTISIVTAKDGSTQYVLLTDAATPQDKTPQETAQDKPSAASMTNLPWIRSIEPKDFTVSTIQTYEIAVDLCFPRSIPWRFAQCMG